MGTVTTQDLIEILEAEIDTLSVEYDAMWNAMEDLETVLYVDPPSDAGALQRVQDKHDDLEQMCWIVRDDIEALEHTVTYLQRAQYAAMDNELIAEGAHA